MFVRRQGSFRIGAAVIWCSVLAAFCYEPAAAAQPALPQAFVDTSIVASTGKTISVPAGGDLQAALNTALPGDVIELDPGATYAGSFTLPNKTGSGWITVRSSGAETNLPPAGTRISPSDAGAMAKIVAGVSNGGIFNDAAIKTIAGSHHFRFIGVEVKPAPGRFVFNLIQLGNEESDINQVPHHLIFDRCYVHGDPTIGGRRGFSINGANLAVIDSYVSDFKERGADTQAVWGANAPGPFAILNNYLEAAGENILFGGAGPVIRNLVPSDIEIRGNHFSKPMSWKVGDRSSDGSNWTVKNLLEIKMGQRVLIDGNLFTNLWPAAQSGYAVLFTPRTEAGRAAHIVVNDISFTNNVLHDVYSGLYAFGIDSDYPSAGVRLHRVAMKNNLFYNVAYDFVMLDNTVSDFTLEHNTADQGNSFLVFGGPSGNFSTGVVVRDNIGRHNDYGVFGSDRGVGNPALDYYSPNAVFQANVLAGPFSVNPIEPLYNHYPGNSFPANTGAVGFTDRANHDYRLSPSSPYKNAATDGTDVGVDFDALDDSMNGAAVTQASSPPPADSQPSSSSSVDDVPPAVRITSPTFANTVSGTVDIETAASDNVGVTMIEYRVDGVLVAGFSPPRYSFAWDSTTVPSGWHTLSATAYDAAGNTATFSVAVFVSNGDSSHRAD